MVRKRSETRAYKSGDDRRAEIVEAAFKCVQEFGYAKLTARKIAETSGISLGHITYNFQDMNEVLVETYRYASRTLFDATQEDLGKAAEAPLDKLRVFLRTGFTPTFLKKDYIRVRVDLWSAALAHGEIAQTELALYQRYRDNLAAIVSDIAAERGRASEDVPLIVDTIMATLDGLWLDWERRQSQDAVDNGLEGCLRLVGALLPE